MNRNTFFTVNALIIVIISSCARNNENDSRHFTEIRHTKEHIIQSSQIDSLHLPSPIESEVLGGWLQINAKEDTVFNRLGMAEKGELKYWGALGTFVEEWKYKTHGLIIQMESEEANTEKWVRGITAAYPCTLQTTQMVKVGSTERNVLDRYAKLIDSTSSVTNKQIVIGTIYGGTIFHIDSDTVKSIFIGVASE